MYIFNSKICFFFKYIVNHYTAHEQISEGIPVLNFLLHFFYSTFMDVPNIVNQIKSLKQS